MQFLLLFLIFLASEAEATIPSDIREANLTLPNGTRLKVFSKCPTRKSRVKLPAVLIFGGFETGAQVLEMIELRQPLCLITFQYPISPPNSKSVIEILRFLPKAKAAVHDTLTGVTELVKWAGRQEQTDPQRIILVGVSIGSPFVTVAAAQMPKVAALVLIHGFGDIRRTIAFNLASEWNSRFGHTLGTALASLAARFLWRYVDFPADEQEIRRLHSGQHVLLLTAAEDDLLPPEATESLRSGLRQSDATWNELKSAGGHIRPGQTAKIAMLEAQALKWLEAKQLIDP